MVRKNSMLLNFQLLQDYHEWLRVEVVPTDTFFRLSFTDGRRRIIRRTDDDRGHEFSGRKDMSSGTVTLTPRGFSEPISIRCKKEKRSESFGDDVRFYIDFTQVGPIACGVHISEDYLNLRPQTTAPLFKHMGKK